MTSKIWPIHSPFEVPYMRRSASHWRIAVTALVGLWLALLSLQVQALALGRLSVQSALGEALHAEIEVPEINAQEAGSLSVRVAPEATFRAAGMEFNPLLLTLQVSLERRPDGRAYLRLSQSRPVNEPFLDLILEVQWANGRLVRDYTLLLDPPNLRPTNNTPTLAQLPASSGAPIVVAQQADGTSQNVPASISSTGISPVASPTTTTTSPTLPARQTVSASAPTASTPQVTSSVGARNRTTTSPTAQKLQIAGASQSQITVQKGDTAGKIAADHKPEGVSLDQMLVALLRTNPEAFTAGNMNRLKAGAVLSLPTAEQAQGESAQQATLTVQTQARDFNEFRRKLAQNAPTAQTPNALRQASGQVQTQVREDKPQAPAKDKLTLSKGSVQEQAADTEKEKAIAQSRQAQDTAVRSAELSKNISELAQLAGSAPITAPVRTPTVTTTPSSSLTGQTSTTMPGVAVLPPTTAPVSGSNTSTATPQAAASARASSPASAPSVAPAVSSEPSLLNALMDNPMTLPAAGALVVLLAGLAFYQARQRRKLTQAQSSLLGGSVAPDSFFGASGGQQVDTSQAESNSSILYSPSQLDASADVDPVAEAEVYMAYGRDLQAEEILKEALHTRPSRIDIHRKLLDIYAKRNDAQAFHAAALNAQALLQSQGQDWVAVCEQGLSLDPSNPLYKLGVPLDTHSVATASSDALADIDDSSFATSETLPLDVQFGLPPQTQGPNASGLVLDLNLDELPGEAPSIIGVADLPAATTTPPKMQPHTNETNDQGLELANKLLLEPDSDLDLEVALAKPAQPSDAWAAANMLEFDLGDLSLDLDTPQKTTGATDHTPPAASDADEDPLQVRLSLAREFHAMGDKDGARVVAQEVADQATGVLKAQAQKLLLEIG